MARPGKLRLLLALLVAPLARDELLGVGGHLLLRSHVRLPHRGQIALVVLRREVAVLEDLEDVLQVVAHLGAQPQDAHHLRGLHLRVAEGQQGLQDVEQGLRRIGLYAQVPAQLHQGRLRELVERLARVMSPELQIQGVPIKGYMGPSRVGGGGTSVSIYGMGVGLLHGRL